MPSDTFNLAPDEYRAAMLADTSGENFLPLFDFLPMVSFYAKNTESRFFHVNRRFLEQAGCRHLEEIVGKCDFDLYPSAVAARYVEEDQRVMSQGRALPNQLWMVPELGGLMRWWVSSKAPLKNEAGQVIGVAGVMYEVGSQGVVLAPYDRVAPALDRIHKDFASPLAVAELAERCHLSVSQFGRVFTSLLGESPSRYLLRVRLDAARALLSRTDMTQTEIALEVGLYDASNLGRKFREFFGQTPRAYRKEIVGIVAASSGGDRSMR